MKMKKVIIVQPLFISNASRCSDHTQKSFVSCWCFHTEKTLRGMTFYVNITNMCQYIQELLAFCKDLSKFKHNVKVSH